MRLVSAKDVRVGDIIHPYIHNPSLAWQVKQVGRETYMTREYVQVMCPEVTLYSPDTLLAISRPWVEDQTFGGWMDDVERLLPDAQATVKKFQDFRHDYHVVSGASNAVDALRPLYEKLDEYFSYCKPE